ncbi:divergent polysaccharide deacetylase family protein [Aquicoccus sp. SU-CL01552]|uniref:divergent polysaccharide deacetylase family protein n=1 Tax=Aquicoccus sp. SU-CL01552 TaxID=3127656 RepID=UPI003102EA27
MRGFIGGLVLGAVLMAAGAAGLSLLVPLQRPDVATESPTVAAGGNTGGGEAGVAPAGTDADLVEAAPIAPRGAGTTPDDLTPMENADTQPADKPRVGDATAGLNDPEQAPGAPELAAGGEMPVTPQGPSGGPDAPMQEAGVPSVSDPAQPAPPTVPQTGSGFDTTPPEGEGAPEVASLADPERSAAPSPAAGTSPDGETAPEVGTDPGAAPQAQPAPEAVAGADNAPAMPEGTPPATTSMADDMPGADPDADDAPDSRIAALPQAGAEPGASDRGPAIGIPVKPLTERDEPQGAAPDGPPPLERYAAPFDNPEDRPLMSIVLIDDAGSIGAEALADFPYPLTFAVDPALPDAADRMARHRAAGFEVVLLADLPAAATPQDAEVALEVWRDTLPEAVAILEGTGTGVQGNRALSDQVTDIAQGTGLGLITQANGLNTVQKLAVRAGVPSAVVFRDFDGAGQTPVVMRRFLDQAAFRAGQEGAVIMLGRVRPDTISALLLWGLQDRAERVALAPVSAVLTRTPEAQ